jgi:hypothetical protein
MKRWMSAIRLNDIKQHFNHNRPMPQGPTPISQIGSLQGAAKASCAAKKGG